MGLGPFPVWRKVRIVQKQCVWVYLLRPRATRHEATGAGDLGSPSFLSSTSFSGHFVANVSCGMCVILRGVWAVRCVCRVACVSSYVNQNTSKMPFFTVQG